MSREIEEIELTVKWGAKLTKVKRLAKKLAIKYNVNVIFWHNDKCYQVKTK